MSILTRLGLVIALTMFNYAAGAEEYTATTTSDPNIPAEELKLLVKPLLLEEVEVEAQAWIQLLQNKAAEISQAEITIKQKNKETKAAEKVADGLEEAAEAPTNTDAIEEIAEVAEEAGEIEVEIDSTNDLEESAEAAQLVAEKAAVDKTNILDTKNKLQEELVVLSIQVNTVLKDIDSKGGDTESLKKYVAVVTKEEIDLKDQQALKSSIERWLSSDNGAVGWSKKIVTFAIIILIFWIISGIVGKIFDRIIKRQRRMSMLLRNFLSNLVRRITIFVGILIGLPILGIETGLVLTAIGAAGFIIAFALQDSLSNFANGIMILLYRPFDVGNFVETGGISGKVVSLNLVSVSISTPDNKLIIVPNNKVWNDVIINATSVKERRVDMIFGIGYEDDMAKAQAILEDIVAKHESILEDPEPVIKVHELADSSVNYVCRPWVKTADYWDVYWDVTRQVKEEFDKQGVSIPYPQQDVHMHQVNPEASTD